MLRSEVEERAPAKFLEWAFGACRALPSTPEECSYEDVRSLGNLIGDCPVVALGEAVHGAAEPLTFRNRLFEYLVQEKGFTAIALESGLLEGRVVDDYVQGGKHDLKVVLARGLSWQFGSLPQNRELVEWLRAYNTNAHATRKVRFYGFDVPGSPGEPAAAVGMDTALVELLRYLREVDAPVAEVFAGRLGSLLTNLRFDFARPPDTPGYDRLTASERDTLTTVIADLVDLLKRRERAYGQRSGLTAYGWAYRAAVCAVQVDGWLRQIPIGWNPTEEALRFPSPQTQFLARAHDIRDRAQAENLKWIVSEEGTSGKVLCFAHRFHVSTWPVQVSWSGSQHDTMGSYLRRECGSRLITIGNVIGRGSIDGGGGGEIGIAAVEGSFDALVGRLGYSSFVLDLRQAPAETARWLNREQLLGQGPINQGSDVLSTAVGRAFDVLYYIDEVTPASCTRRHSPGSA